MRTDLVQQLVPPGGQIALNAALPRFPPGLRPPWRGEAASRPSRAAVWPQTRPPCPGPTGAERGPRLGRPSANCWRSRSSICSNVRCLACPGPPHNSSPPGARRVRFHEACSSAAGLADPPGPHAMAMQVVDLFKWSRSTMPRATGPRLPAMPPTGAVPASGPVSGIVRALLLHQGQQIAGQHQYQATTPPATSRRQHQGGIPERGDAVVSIWPSAATTARSPMRHKHHAQQGQQARTCMRLAPDGEGQAHRQSPPAAAARPMRQRLRRTIRKVQCRDQAGQTDGDQHPSAHGQATQTPRRPTPALRHDHTHHRQHQPTNGGSQPAAACSGAKPTEASNTPRQQAACPNWAPRRWVITSASASHCRRQRDAHAPGREKPAPLTSWRCPPVRLGALHRLRPWVLAR